MATRRRSSAAKSSRRSSKRSSAATSSRRSRSGSGVRGTAGVDRIEQELNKQEQRREQAQAGGTPFRLYLMPGDTKQIIVCDDQLEELYFRDEHNLKNPQTGKYGLHAGCIKSTQTCPICEKTGKESYYALFLTVIDLTEFEDRKGNVHEFSRKIMCIKASQAQKFIRRCKKNGGSLRGAMFTLARDGKRDAAIGNDIEYEEKVPEEEMAEYVRVWEDREGKEHEEACDEVYDYDKLFPEPTKQELAKLVGGYAAPGSDEEFEDEVDDDEDMEDEDEDSEWGKGKTRRGRKGRNSSRGRKSSTSRKRGRRKDEDEEEEDLEDDVDEEELDEDVVDEEEEDEPPFDPDEDEEPEEEEDEEEEEKPRRGRRKTARGSTRRGRKSSRRSRR